jgi:hypothetical protein
LMNGQLTERSQQLADSGPQPCPDCGQSSSRSEM